MLMFDTTKNMFKIKNLHLEGPKTDEESCQGGRR